MSPRMLVSVSGGRTSARMAKLLKEHKAREYDLRFVFANTGWEHPDTLRFVNDLNRHLGLGLVWVEAEIRPGKGEGTTHRVVNYETASRNGEPFRAMAAKYGLPNKSFPHCTRELKLNAMKSYLRSIGWDHGTYVSAVGIRTDENRRVKPTAGANHIIYPLRDWWPHDKDDVLAYWEDFDWDLAIEEYEGNCLGCYKKSDKKLNTLWRTRPDVFQFPMMLHMLYDDVGQRVPEPRKMYRGHRSAIELVAEFKRLDVDTSRTFSDADAGTCSESCEVLETMGEDELLAHMLS